MTTIIERQAIGKEVRKDTIIKELSEDGVSLSNMAMKDERTIAFMTGIPRRTVNRLLHELLDQGRVGFTPDCEDGCYLWHVIPEKEAA